MLRLTSILALAFFCFGQSYAQNEILREQSSLRGITEFGIVVNIEKTGSVHNESLNTASIRKRISARFEELGIRILNDETLSESDQYPILHFHVNIMKASNNTFPYSIEMNFYQPVKLILNRDLQTMASTWNKGLVGVVSEDQLFRIANQVVYSSDLFKDEFLLVN